VRLLNVNAWRLQRGHEEKRVVDINRVVLMGRLTRDADLRYTQSGDPVLSFRLGFSTWGKASDGSWGERSNFVGAVMFGRQAETLAPYLTKGMRVAVDGRLRWREWQSSEGDKHQVIEVLIDELQLLERGRERSRKRERARGGVDAGPA
jgi:single-strand DNA-binding protein